MVRARWSRQRAEHNAPRAALRLRWLGGYPKVIRAARHATGTSARLWRKKTVKTVFFKFVQPSSGQLTGSRGLAILRPDNCGAGGHPWSWCGCCRSRCHDVHVEYVKKPAAYESASLVLRSRYMFYQHDNVKATRGKLEGKVGRVQLSLSIIRGGGMRSRGATSPT
jgi:hypothetical protein